MGIGQDLLQGDLLALGIEVQQIKAGAGVKGSEGDVQCLLQKGLGQVQGRNKLGSRAILFKDHAVVGNQESTGGDKEADVLDFKQ